ncbi:MAG TPA: hypothetical protein VL688_00765 [Verrucomicrobiae bacterium]|nr:hypothetical protein [Verrucomicrobiae bacterium]
MNTKNPDSKKEKKPEPRQPAVCPECGMDRTDWSNKGKGVVHDDVTYCCVGCAEGRDCECE